MALNTPRKIRKRVNFRRDLRQYTYLGCPLTKNRSPWCFRICKPNDDGIGLCGRVAPHGFKSRIQRSIDDFKRRQIDSPGSHHNQEPAGNKDS
jgi:hypothetical protein